MQSDLDGTPSPPFSTRKGVISGLLRLLSFRKEEEREVLSRTSRSALAYVIISPFLFFFYFCALNIILR